MCRATFSSIVSPKTELEIRVEWCDLLLKIYIFQSIFQASVRLTATKWIALVVGNSAFFVLLEWERGIVWEETEIWFNKSCASGGNNGVFDRFPHELLRAEFWKDYLYSSLQTRTQYRTRQRPGENTILHYFSAFPLCGSHNDKICGFCENFL